MEKNYIYHQIDTSEIVIKAYRWMTQTEDIFCDRIITDFDIIYIEDGEYEISINNKTYFPKNGDIFLVPPGAILKMKATKVSHHFYCHFSMYTTSKESLGLTLNDYMFPEQFKEIILPYISEINKFKNNSDILFPYTIKILLKLFLISLISLSPDNQLYFLGECNNNLPNEVMIALNYIHNNLKTDINTKTLAQLSGFNPAYFSRYFKKYVGSTPTQYSITYRFDYAHHLVTSTSKSLKEISELIGFSDQFAFSKQFKKHYSFSPSELRKIQT